jgi:hypothetical protein
MAVAMWMSSSNRGSAQRKKIAEDVGSGVKRSEHVSGTVFIPLPGEEILG